VKGILQWTTIATISPTGESSHIGRVNFVQRFARLRSVVTDEYPRDYFELFETCRCDDAATMRHERRTEV
jgi:hypothetical protein